MGLSRRFHRNELLFGRDGQDRIAQARVAIVGLGGIGSHVAQQLAYLGVRDFALVDRDLVTVSSLNRLVGAVEGDVGREKVDVAGRLIRQVREDAHVNPISQTLISATGFAAVTQADYVFGCVDKDGVRFVLNELCSAYERPYFDIATDVLPEDSGIMFGGRMVLSRGNLCLVCTRELDQDEVRRDLSTPEQREQEDRLYGISRGALGDQGPSVVSLNGILASLTVTEFMVLVTGLREPKEHLRYYGMGFRDGRVTAKDAPDIQGCYYCAGIKGKGKAADTERFIREGIGTHL
jgi:hypothetical protein